MPDAISYVWKDRKRILGMPISFTRYAMSNDRIFLETGLLNTHAEELLLYRVRDISLGISLGQKMFGVGSVLLHSSDKTTPTLELKNIKDPRAVKELIHQHVEEMKLQRRVRIGEVMENQDEIEDDE